MTKSEKIELLELKLSNAQNESGKLRKELSDLKDKMPSCCYVDTKGVTGEADGRINVDITARVVPCFVANMRNVKSFCNALQGFIEKWNRETAEEAGCVVE